MSETIGDRLKKLRIEFGFTQKQLADYLGFKQSQIVKLEKNERTLKISSLDKLCDLYNCDADYILEGKGIYEKPIFAFRSNKRDLKLDTLADMNLIIKNLNRLSEILGDGDEF